MSRRLQKLQRFFQELKRRNVYKVAATYLAVAFVGFQAVTLLIPSTTLPPWADELILALIIIGFPVSLVVAWAFALTPEGMRRTSSLERPEPEHAPEEQSGAGSPGPRPGESPRTASPRPREDGKSVAVLPFTNVSPDPDDEYLSDGITEELIGALAGVQDLQVAARTSVFAYKGKNEDVRTIGRELGVEHLLDGSVRRAGDRLRISADLVDTKRGYQLWSKTFDRNLEDVFAIQEEIAQAIVDHLKVRLLRPEADLVEYGTEDLEAYNLYLEGRYHLNRRTWRSLDRGREAFGRSVDEDPEFARAYAGLADTHLLLERYGVVPPGESVPVAKQAARQAIELDDSQPEPHVSLAYAYVIGDWDLKAGSKEFQRAIELDPEHAPARHWYGWCLAAQGRLEDALSELEEAWNLEPLSLIIRANIGTFQYFRRRFDEAARHLEDTLELNPTFAVALQWLGRVHQAADRLPDAIDAFRKALNVLGDDPESLASLGYALGQAGQRVEAAELRERLVNLASGARYVSPYWHGLILLGLGDRDRGLEEMERAFDVRFDWLLYLQLDPLFDPYRGDERFDALAEEVARATTYPGR